MFDFYERRKIKQWLYSWPFLIVLIVVSAFLIHSVWGVYQKERLTNINKKQRLTHLKDLEKRKDALQKEINRLNTERGIEEDIRQKFEMVKDGEREIIIVDTPLNTSKARDEGSVGMLDRFINMVIFWK